jgi:hypothetical protein
MSRVDYPPQGKIPKRENAKRIEILNVGILMVQILNNVYVIIP